MIDYTTLPETDIIYRLLKTRRNTQVYNYT